ncbi:MAG: OprD family outer membrane porin [Methyloceanibacter sp.]
MARFNLLAALRGVTVLALLCMASGQAAVAQGAGGEGGSQGGPTDYPLPGTAHEVYSPIGEGFDSPIDPRADLKGPKPYVDDREARLKAARARTPALNPFFRDTELTANSRTYWFDEDDFGFSNPRALTTGGHLSYQSGYLADFLQLRAALYTTQPLYAPPGAGETMNLTPDGDQITTLGQANARLKFAGQELTVGRQLVRTPFINPFDVRMIPLTYEGIVLLPERRGEQTLDYIASYLWRYKPRDSADFIPLSEGLGVEQDEGVLITGVRHRTNSLNYGLVNYWIKDTMNTAYGEVDYALRLGGGDDAPSFRVSVNDADQRSVGEDLIPGGPFATYQLSARLVAGFQGFVLTGATSRVGRDAEFRKPFGSSASYTSMIISSFTHAGETGYLASLSYDLSRIGLKGLKAYVGWGHGVDAIDPQTGAALADWNELDLRLEYEPHGGPLEGLRVKVEHVEVRLSDTPPPHDELKEFRAIVNYRLPLL